MMNKESKHTAFDPEFHEMEQETDVTINALKGFVNKVSEHTLPSSMTSGRQAYITHALHRCRTICTRTQQPVFAQV